VVESSIEWLWGWEGSRSCRFVWCTYSALLAASTDVKKVHGNIMCSKRMMPDDMCASSSCMLQHSHDACSMQGAFTRQQPNEL
jgi:hypothetical protein